RRFFARISPSATLTFSPAKSRHSTNTDNARHQAITPLSSVTTRHSTGYNCQTGSASRFSPLHATQPRPAPAFVPRASRFPRRFGCMALMLNSRMLHLVAALVAASLLLAPSCQKAEQIQSYTVPKEPKIERAAAATLAAKPGQP